MAECDPRDPPPLLREPYRKFPTVAEKNEQERLEWERQQDRVWANTFGYVRSSGCLLLILFPLLAVLGSYGYASRLHAAARVVCASHEPSHRLAR